MPLLDRYISSSTAVRERTVTAVKGAWDSLESFRDADYAAFLTRIKPTILAGQTATINLTNAYLSQEFGQPLAKINPQEYIGDHVRGVPFDEVYTRPATAIYTALSEEKAIAAAVAEGWRRLESILRTDQQLVKFRASRDRMKTAPTRFYRRVLGGGKNCALCALASTQRYFKEDLQPIHPGCNCSVAPLSGNWANRQVIDEDLLEKIHDGVEGLAGWSDRGGRGPDYRDIAIREHGEYGPTLTWRNQKFTSEKEI